MMHGPGKSDSAIVAVKPTNKAGRPAAEPVERRAEAEENAGQQHTRRALLRRPRENFIDLPTTQSDSGSRRCEFR
jgi:hypothetical protein